MSDFKLKIVKGEIKLIPISKPVIWNPLKDKTKQKKGGK